MIESIYISCVVFLQNLYQNVLAAVLKISINCFLYMYSYAFVDFPV